MSKRVKRTEKLSVKSNKLVTSQPPQEVIKYVRQESDVAFIHLLWSNTMYPTNQLHISVSLHSLVPAISVPDIPKLQETENTQRDMARLCLVSSLIFFLVSCAAAASSFEDSNPIRLVSDGLRDFESQVLQVVGNTRHALSFARFAHRCSSTPTDRFPSSYLVYFIL